MNDSIISDRAQQLLQHLVHLYITHGQPIGSKTLVCEAFPTLSPATVRKVLGDLEDNGYITSLHTSSGRVPTTRGLRFFVDRLLAVHPLDSSTAWQVSKKLEYDSIDENLPLEGLITKTSQVLSELTHSVGIVTLPSQPIQILRHVEFLPLADNRVLAILVFNERDVQNRIIETECVYTASELAQVGNFLTQHFAGKDLSLARDELFKQLNADRASLDSLMKTVVDMASKTFAPSPKHQDYILSGQQNLFANPLATVQQLQGLFEAFTQKRQILHMFDQCMATDGVQMFIGEESGCDAFKNYSVITSRYRVEGKTVGVLGIIGPTRMQYDRVIPVVELTAKVLGKLLNSDK